MKKYWEARIKEAEWWIAHKKGDDRPGPNELTFGEQRLVYLKMMRDHEDSQIGGIA